MISIVTAYYNRKELFIRTLKSIASTRYKGDFEVIAVDDGSREEERLEDLVKEFPFLKIIYLDPQKKWYHNSCIPFNIGIKSAKGDSIILQNPECYHYGDILQTTDLQLNNNNYLSFGCFSLDKNTTDHFDTIFTPDYFSKLICRHNYSPTKDGEFGWYNHSLYRPQAFHFCTAISKQSLKKLKGFDERFALGIAFDDNEFIERIKKFLKIEFIDQVIVLHQNHYSPLSNSFENRKNKIMLYKFNQDLLTFRINRINYNDILNFIPWYYKKNIIFFIIKLERKLRIIRKKITTMHKINLFPCNKEH